MLSPSLAIPFLCGLCSCLCSASGACAYVLRARVRAPLLPSLLTPSRQWQPVAVALCMAIPNHAGFCKGCVPVRVAGLAQSPACRPHRCVRLSRWSARWCRRVGVGRHRRLPDGPRTALLSGRESRRAEALSLSRRPLRWAARGPASGLAPGSQPAGGSKRVRACTEPSAWALAPVATAPRPAAPHYSRRP